MAIEPEVFHVRESKLRWTQLPALVLAREHGKLIQQADQGALDMLAFQLTEDDQTALVSGRPQAMFVMLKTVATVLDGGSALDDLCLHYLAVGKVEVCVEAGDKSLWMPLYGEKVDENLGMLADPFDMYGAVWRVLKGILGPLFDLLRPSNEAAAEQTNGSGSSTPTEGDSPAAPS